MALVSLGLGCADAPFEQAASSPLLVPDGVDPPGNQAPTQLLDANGQPFRPVHATLLPNGNVLMTSIGSAAISATMTPTPAYVPSPASVTLGAEAVPVDATALQFGQYVISDTIFCGGQTLLADGTVFYAGGTRFIEDPQNDAYYVVGLPYAITYKDGVWNRVATDMTGTGEQGTNERWYPATTKLRDGRVLVTSGRDLVLYSVGGQGVQIGTKNRSVEIFDPQTASWSVVSTHAQTPDAIYNPDYSHVFVLPYDTEFDALALGGAGVPHVFSSTQAPNWFSTSHVRPDTAVDGQGALLEEPNVGASSLMLPIRVNNGEFGYFNGSLLVAGGTFNRPHEHSYDVYDPIGGGWLQRNDMASRRHHPSTVLLPDGTILILAGHDDTDGSNLVRHASIVDPRNGFTRDDGISDLGESRGYHTVSLLLPDGRVLLAGGRSAGAGGPEDEKPNMRYYYPPYMSLPRPQITAAPSTMTYDESFDVTWAGGDLREAVLVSLGSMTHSVDLNQRHIELQIEAVDQVAKTATLRAPDGGWTAPPGHYMLFLLDANLGPSPARIVQIQ